jgi:hypothetical protein
MTVICQALACLFAFVALLPTRPVEVRIDYTPTPAAWSNR